MAIKIMIENQMHRGKGVKIGGLWSNRDFHFLAKMAWRLVR